MGKIINFGGLGSRKQERMENHLREQSWDARSFVFFFLFFFFFFFFFFFGGGGGNKELDHTGRTSP